MTNILRKLYAIRKINTLTLRNILQRQLDNFRGLDFLSIIEPETVGLDSSNVFRSSPSGGSYLSSALNNLHVNSNDRIVDVGCGKGSAIRTMLRYPFSKIAGIELSYEIGIIASTNFQKIKDNRVSIHIGDACTYDRYNEFNIIYFYNPFPNNIMEKVLNKIKCAHTKTDTELIIIYNNPTCHDVIIENNFYWLKNFPDEWGNGIAIYSSRDAKNSRLS